MCETIEAKCIVTLCFVLVPEKILSLIHPVCVCARNVWDVVVFDSIQASILPIEFDDSGPAAVSMETAVEIDSQQQTTDQSNCLFEHPMCVSISMYIHLHTFLQLISM